LTKKSKKISIAINNLIDVQEAIIRMLLKKRVISIKDIREEDLDWVADMLLEDDSFSECQEKYR